MALMACGGDNATGDAEPSLVGTWRGIARRSTYNPTTGVTVVEDTVAVVVRSTGTIAVGEAPIDATILVNGTAHPVASSSRALIGGFNVYASDGSSFVECLVSQADRCSGRAHTPKLGEGYATPIDLMR